MTSSDIKSLPQYDFEVLSEIMILEEKFQQKDIEKQNQRNTYFRKK